MPSDPQQNGGRLQDWIGVRPYSHDHLCSRSTVPALLGSSVKKASQGGYIAVNTPGTPALILLATGSEVGFCVKAAKALQKQGIATRVVSMPCQEVFLRQSQDYQETFLP